MDLSWYKGILFGLFAGLTEIFPVSSQAHRLLMMKMFGFSSEPELLQLMIDLGMLAAFYYASQNHIIRIIRAKRLSRVPKRRRKRPLDTMSLMDLSLLKTMLIPVILGFFVYEKLQPMGSKMLWVALMLLLNGLILYVPQFLPGGNRDSRNMSRVQGFLIGLGGAISVVPGLSGVGAATSVSSVCGVDRSYGLNMTLLLNMFICAGLAVFDVLAMVSTGIDNASFGTVLVYLLSGVAAFGGTTLGIRVMRSLAPDIGYGFFAYYCWGVALFTLIMNLLA